MAAGRDEGRLEEVADVSDKIVTWAGELAESEDCDDLIADTIDEFGQIDCLVNNAGILIRGSVEELSDEDWRQTMTSTSMCHFSSAVPPCHSCCKQGAASSTSRPTGGSMAASARHPIAPVRVGLFY